MSKSSAFLRTKRGVKIDLTLVFAEEDRQKMVYSMYYCIALSPYIVWSKTTSIFDNFSLIIENRFGS
jgi:hypothetical protein